MRRRFNVTGLCIPEEDYMVDISGKIAQIRQLVDERRYFTINRARQYGKTTTLYHLKRALRYDYIVASLNFENLGEENFQSADIFCSTFARLIREAIDISYVSEKIRDYKIENYAASFERLSKFVTEICKGAESAPIGKKIVLMIDEVDKSSNNRIFLHFLAMLRDKFLARKAGKDYTFHSVILAGVHDVKNLKLKMINEGTYAPTATEGKLLNSPWNIAVEFDDLIKNIKNNSELSDFLYSLLIVGEKYTFNVDSTVIELGAMYGFLCEGEDRKVKISNRIFETRICNYYIACNEVSKKLAFDVGQCDVMSGKRFSMELCLAKFAKHYAEIYNEIDEKFMEREGRLLFLSYLRPLINGQGHYHIESQLTNRRRMDLVVDYGGGSSLYWNSNSGKTRRNTRKHTSSLPVTWKPKTQTQVIC